MSVTSLCSAGLMTTLAAGICVGSASVAAVASVTPCPTGFSTTPAPVGLAPDQGGDLVVVVVPGDRVDVDGGCGASGRAGRGGRVHLVGMLHYGLQVSGFEVLARY